MIIFILLSFYSCVTAEIPLADLRGHVDVDPRRVAASRPNKINIPLHLGLIFRKFECKYVLQAFLLSEDQLQFSLRRLFTSRPIFSIDIAQITS